MWQQVLKWLINFLKKINFRFALKINLKQKRSFKLDHSGNCFIYLLILAFFLLSYTLFYFFMHFVSFTSLFCSVFILVCLFTLYFNFRNKILKKFFARKFPLVPFLAVLFNFYFCVFYVCFSFLILLFCVCFLLLLFLFFCLIFFNFFFQIFLRSRFFHLAALGHHTVVVHLCYRKIQ